ncbi:paraquat-inducible protein A [Thalassotalea sp. G2M2-11]|uniref:paraquat-inducible protein A n=1 Tax=Thalassotalea sp. G2M2-11 TaxID=2787627 RepID=UPI0019CFDE4A|nr:paraquat-inducible protein A [Thalassotalea sp. G2M2-11]
MSGKKWSKPLLYRASKLGLSSCPCCQKLNYLAQPNARCARCHTQLSFRKSHSQQLTLAWTIAALLMFIPANIYPIMLIYKMGVPEANTILTGIVTLVKNGLYPIAAVIFLASFIIPFIKIIGLFFLLYNTRRYSNISRTKQSQFYRMIEWLGPWSMLDVFVVTIMAALVNLGFFSSIEAAAGLSYFALMVIFTMLAAHSFDVRLLWDIERRNIHV